jgi:hypothetical protein
VFLAAVQRSGRTPGYRLPVHAAGHGNLVLCARRALARSYEYEDWPRGRITFDRGRDRFILYADRKLLTPAMIARIKAQFLLPEERAEVQTDLHGAVAEVVGI